MSTETTQQKSETFGFQTEAKQLLKLMIHSLYSSREIFLRELISNASDAIDKLRFAVISDPALATSEEPAIVIGFDADAKTVSITDNGIGMTRQEVIDNLGTIAKSGTAEFLNQLSGDNKTDAALIGQFGVGFYSAFIVAEEVEVITRRVGDSEGGTRWVSRGEEDFTIEEVGEVPYGTQVTLHLTTDAHEFADDFRLRNIVVKYSDHIGVPVKMAKLETPEAAEQNAEESAEGSADASTNSSAVEENEAPVLEAVNAAKALWTRSKSEVSDEEYKEFYKHISHDFGDPQVWSHNKVEGSLEYTSLLYIPKKAPFDMWNRDLPRGLKLYVQRVFIMDEVEQFLPLYLRFVKGVIDSNDLPLNVSREILQNDSKITTIRNALTKRVINLLDTMAKKQPEDYQVFWEEFGEVIKEGVGEDFSNREALAKLLRFHSTKVDDLDETGKPAKTGNLAEYLDRFIEGQDQIYYLLAENYESAKNSPHLEIFKKKGIEVLLLVDRIDEWLMGSLTEYDGKNLQDVMRGDLNLPGETAPDPETADDDLSKRMKSVLDTRVDAVRPSSRLTDSPACLVLNDMAMGIQMRRIMEQSGQSMPETKPSFEYNAEHALVQRLDTETDEDRFADLVLILFDQATLADGSSLEDSSGYVNRVNRLLETLLSG